MSIKEVLEAVNGLAARLSEMSTRMAKLEGQVNQVVKWTQRQDISLENEMTKQLLVYLQEHYKGYVSNEDVRFPKSINLNGKTLTDLDGVILMSNGTNTILVVVEAKQCVTLHKLRSKLHQKVVIEQLLAEIKTGKITVPVELQAFDISTFNDKVGLYIGAIEFKKGVKEELLEHAEENPLCGFIELNGSRFSVNDKRNDFGKLLYGGKKK
jgi:hypothetical protein